MKKQNSNKRNRPSRAFLIVSIFMIVIFLIGLGILVISLSAPKLLPAALTATAESGTPLPLNMTHVAQVTQTAESAILTAQATLDATSHQQE